MDFLTSAYGGAEEEESPCVPLPMINAAPPVKKMPPKGYVVPQAEQELRYKSLPTGYAEDEVLADFVFDQHYNSYLRSGIAVNPDGSTPRIFDQGQSNNNRRQRRKRKKQRSAAGSADDLEGFKGPWAPYHEKPREYPVVEAQEAKDDADDEDQTAGKDGDVVEEDDQAPGAKKAKTGDGDADQPGGESTAQNEAEEAEGSTTALVSTSDAGEGGDGDASGDSPKDDDEGEDGPQALPDLDVGDETSKFHGREMYDYQGRSYLWPPSHVKDRPHDNFIPKKQIYTYKGHTKAVNIIKLFPKFGHLLLSGSSDTKIKIWDVYNDRRVLRTYFGHGGAVRDLAFNYDGSTFLSASYDRTLKLWDTETGDCIARYGTGARPYCVEFHPDPAKQDVFVTGMSDKKIIQFDVRSREMTLEYDQHLGPVNSITFLDGNRRFVSSSDDKTLRVWEWGIPVVIKYISEPHMHSMPSVAAHPNGEWYIAQSLDNQILVYQGLDRFRINKKKRFMGHTVAGYACQCGFSPDGRFVLSGDSTGNLWFWDWKSSRVFKKLPNAHRGPSIGAVWHPIETSWVFSCGWDNMIKLWD